MVESDVSPRLRAGLMASRVFAVVTVVLIVVIFLTAGQLIQNYQAEDIHGTAALLLHFATGGLALSLVVVALARRRGWWAAAVAIALFAFTFVQASLGTGALLYLHIPGSLAVTVAAAGLAVWLFSRRLGVTPTTAPQTAR